MNKVNNINNLFYVGGYQKTDNGCLHIAEYTGSKPQLLESCEITNASYLCMSADKKTLYAVIETDVFRGQKGGGVAAFAIEENGMLRLLNVAQTEGEHPCHLSVCPKNRMLYAANYTSGSSIIFNLQDDDSIGLKKRLIDHSSFGKPSGVVNRRQDSPHAHYIQCRNAETVWVCDLGLDLVLVLDPEGELLTSLSMPPGFGPRHIDFHPSLPVAYVVGELGQAVITVRYTGLNLEADLPIPVAPQVKVSCAAVRVSPCGKFLLCSNRGVGGSVDSLSVLNLDDNGGITGLLSIYETKGKCPRDFTFPPKGDEVFVAYQDSDYIEVLKWSDGGKLTPKQVELTVPRPTCILFM